MALTDNLVSYWNLSEASGNRADSHGTNTLTDNGSVGSGTGPDGGTCADLESGSFNWFSHTDNSDLSSGDTNWTLNLWLNFETVAAFGFVGAKGYATGAANYEWLLYLSASSVPSFQVAYNSTPDTVEVVNTTAGAPSTATWYMYTIWHDATNNQIGICRNAGTADTVSHSLGVNDGTSDFLLGTGGTGAYYDGKMAYAGWWRRVLTGAERTTLYNGGSGLAYAALGAASYSPAAGALAMAGLAGQLRYQINMPDEA